MTAFATLLHTIEERHRAQIAAGGDGGASIPTIYSADPTSEPASGQWCRVTVRESSRDQADIGASSIRNRTEGVLLVECFDEGSSGSKTVLELADRVRAAFQRYASGTLTFRTPSLQGGSSPIRVGNWARLIVACPFQFDDLI
jgi:hypothetical protein